MNKNVGCQRSLELEEYESSETPHESEEDTAESDTFKETKGVPTQSSVAARQSNISTQSQEGGKSGTNTGGETQGNWMEAR